MVDDVITNAVAPSVTLGLLRHAAAERGPCDLLGFEAPGHLIRSPGRRREWAKQASAALGGGQAHALARWPGLGLMPANARRALPFLRRALERGGGRLVIHGRGAKGAWIGAWAKRRLPGVSLIYDARGPEAYELYCPDAREIVVPPPGSPMARLLRMEREALAAADATLAISAFRAELLRLDHPDVNFPGPVVAPCAVDAGRFQHFPDARAVLRQIFGVSDKIVFVYAGGAQPYAMTAGLARLCAALGRLAPRETFFLFLSREFPKLAAQLRVAGLPAAQFEARQVAHDDMPRWLSAGDVGLIARPPTVIGRAHAPVKAAEYLACGLSLLVIGQTGDLAQAVAEAPDSLLLPTLDEAVAKVADVWARMRAHGADSEARRMANRALAQQRYSWDAVWPVIRAAYEGAARRG